MPICGKAGTGDISERSQAAGPKWVARRPGPSLCTASLAFTGDDLIFCGESLRRAADASFAIRL